MPAEPAPGGLNVAVASAIETHYTTGALVERIMSALVESGRDPEALRLQDLEPVDAFHIRRGQATRELAALAGMRPGLRVLDVGCGLGGAARYLASAYDCRVTGIDLTKEYCEAATELSQRLGLSDRTEFLRADALDLPFDEGSFDLVWTEHAQMNIEFKWRFYRQIARVLAPGGLLAFHDIFSGPGGDVHYPVPWAGDPSLSHLVSPQELRELLELWGFRVRHWNDVTEPSRRWFRPVSDRIGGDGPRPLETHLLMGADAQRKLANLVRSLEEGRITVIQAVLDLPAHS